MEHIEEKILNIIKSIRESCGSSIAIYTCGNCYQFYEILKTIFPESEAYDAAGHVLTKIDGQFYDIRGKMDVSNLSMTHITEPDRIKSFSKNKWTDQRRIEFSEEYRNKLLNRKR